MKLKYVYGPISSRRLGYSLGISPILKKTCNYSCIYCQLGRTPTLTNRRENKIHLEDIMVEVDYVLKQNTKIDVISIVGEGEPTLYYDLGKLINEVKKKTEKPVCLITNGALLIDKNVQNDIMNVDIVLPSINAYDEETFKKINRPAKNISFKETYNALKEFSSYYKGQIWLEIMLIKGINDDDFSLEKFKTILKDIKYTKLYLNTPIRPPAEDYVEAISKERMKKAVIILGGISIDLLSDEDYQSVVEDDYEAVFSIIKRHPLNQFEIESFLKSRNSNLKSIFFRLDNDIKVEKIYYQGIYTYRLKV